MASSDFLSNEAAEYRLVPRLAAILDQVMASGPDGSVSQAKMPAALASFYAVRPPKISVDDYLDRIYQYASCSSTCLVLAMIYIERLIAREQNLILSHFNVHRLVVSAVMLAAKYLDDLHYDNRYWSKIAGVTVEEINKLELDFLTSLNWEMAVAPEVFFRYYDRIVSSQGPAVAAVLPVTPACAADTFMASVARKTAEDAVATLRVQCC